MISTTLRLGTRGSLLARTQSQLVADALTRAHAGLRVEIVLIKTTGDRVTDRPLAEIGGKGLFTKEIEQALLAGEVDCAVHSYKDVPVTMPLVDARELAIVATPAREDPRDALLTRGGPGGGVTATRAVAKSIRDLPRGAVVGTTSLRRRCQLLAIAPGTNVVDLRGNIDSRVRKLREGQFDAIVLAMAGLRRAGLFDASFTTAIDPADMLPSPGQGALALQCRTADLATVALLSALNDPTTAACVLAEREVVRHLNGDCHSPIAALATVTNGRLTLKAAVGARGGFPPVLVAEASGDVADPASVAVEVSQALERQGVQAHLHGGR